MVEDTSPNPRTAKAVNEMPAQFRGCPFYGRIMAHEVPATTAPKLNRECPEVEAVSTPSFQTYSQGKNEQIECQTPKPTHWKNIFFFIRALSKLFL